LGRHLFSAGGSTQPGTATVLERHVEVPSSIRQDPSGHMTGLDPWHPLVVGQAVRQSPSAHREVEAGHAPVEMGLSMLHDTPSFTQEPSGQRLGVPIRHAGIVGQDATLVWHVPSLQRALPWPQTHSPVVATHFSTLPSPLAHFTGNAAGHLPAVGSTADGGSVVLPSGRTVVS
jgi:hypothetical protein